MFYRSFSPGGFRAVLDHESTWARGCHVDAPQRNLMAQKDSTWISIPIDGLDNGAVGPAGSRPAVRQSNRTCKASPLIWKLPSSTRAPVAFQSPARSCDAPQASESRSDDVRKRGPTGTASGAAKAIPVL